MPGPDDGRLLGVRADMTPQVARIDARHGAPGVPSRMSYIGTVLRTLPDLSCNATPTVRRAGRFTLDQRKETPARSQMPPASIDKH